MALIDCGIVAFHHQNVPIWRCLAKAQADRDCFDRVRVLAVLGNEQEKKYAIQVLGLASQPIATLGALFDKKQVLKSWLSDGADNTTFDAVISFLSANADTDDISLLEEVSVESSSQRRTKIEAAIVGVLFRSGVDAALRRLVEKEVDNIDYEPASCVNLEPRAHRSRTGSGS